MSTPDRAAAQHRNAPDAARPLLTVQQVSRHFGGVQALRNVSLALWPGKVLALVGENGAGKSTLINILSGLYAPDSGQIELDGITLPPGQTHLALRRGLAAVHQELTLFAHLSVWENIFAGHELISPLSRLLRPRLMIERSAELLARLHAPIDPTARVQDLTLAEQQLVEIARALSWNPRLLILDEATSSLDARQVEHVFALVRELKAQGVAVVLVTHRMPEVLEHADQAVVLRDGEVVATFEMLEGVSETTLVEKMVGRSLSTIFPAKAERRAGPIVLQTQALQGTLLKGISLAVRSGEIVGIGGLQGHGQAELLRLLFGAVPAQGGSIQLRGQTQAIHTPRQALAAGIVYVPADRKTEGLLLPHTVEMNLTLPSLEKYLTDRLGNIHQRKEAQTINDLRERMQIRQRQPWQTVESLSGGNQQKVVLGKWLDMPFDLLLLDDPTRGIDVGTKGEIYRLLHDLARRGKAILLSSTDSLELLGLCDRVYVLYEGRIHDELQGERLTEYELTGATMGTTRTKAASQGGTASS